MDWGVAGEGSVCKARKVKFAGTEEVVYQSL